MTHGLRKAQRTRASPDESEQVTGMSSSYGATAPMFISRGLAPNPHTHYPAGSRNIGPAKCASAKPLDLPRWDWIASGSADGTERERSSLFSFRVACHAG